MTTPSPPPLPTPAIRRDYPDGRVTLVPALFVPAAACEAAYRARLRGAYEGVWGALGGALVRAGERGKGAGG